jgi:mono/diheme cytochrome c family protein
MGGDAFTKEFGFPGNFYAKNITPEGVDNWKDGEFLRAISCGVNRDRNAFFPVMPYPYYAHMDKEDIIAIIAYIRTLKPIKNNVPPSEPEFPMSLILNTIPKDAAFTERPQKAINATYGAYLVNAAACAECHTNAIKGNKVEGMDFAGGREFNFPGPKKIVSSNITPDKETGIGYWTEDAFVSKFKTFEDKTKLQDYKSPADYQPVMPWNMYAGMDTVDLKAIFAYLKTLKPIKNKVVSNPVN